jgi:hypothetical protein
MPKTRSSLSTVLKVVVFGVVVSAALGAVSAAIPLIVIVGAMFGIFALAGFLPFLNIDGAKGFKLLIALISLVLNIAAMRYVWTWLQYDLETANYLVSGGATAIGDVWTAATSGSISVRGTDLGDNFLLYSAWASTLAVAFPPVIWGLMSSSTTPSAE